MVECVNMFKYVMSCSKYFSSCVSSLIFISAAMAWLHLATSHANRKLYPRLKILWNFDGYSSNHMRLTFVYIYKTKRSGSCSLDSAHCGSVPHLGFGFVVKPSWCEILLLRLVQTRWINKSIHSHQNQDSGRRTLTRSHIMFRKVYMDKTLLSAKALSFTVGPNVLTPVKRIVQVLDLLLERINGPRRAFVLGGWWFRIIVLAIQCGSKI